MARKPEMIIATDHDFAILRGGRPLASARWDDVLRLLAYKRDEFTTDLVCLDIELRGGRILSVHEEVPGWEDFLDAAERALPDMHSFRSWFPQVAQPPFARSEHVVFEREAPAP
jgi:hypothetical protein